MTAEEEYSLLFYVAHLICVLRNSGCGIHVTRLFVVWFLHCIAKKTPRQNDPISTIISGTQNWQEILLSDCECV